MESVWTVNLPLSLSLKVMPPASSGAAKRQQCASPADILRSRSDGDKFRHLSLVETDWGSVESVFEQKQG
jgi:hypothetical protein